MRQAGEGKEKGAATHLQVISLDRVVCQQRYAAHLEPAQDGAGDVVAATVGRVVEGKVSFVRVHAILVVVVAVVVVEAVVVVVVAVVVEQ